MTITSSSSSHLSFTVTLIVVVIFLPIVFVTGFGSSSTIAISYSSRTVCGIIAGKSNQRIECYSGNQGISIQPSISYEGISGGKDFFCGLISGGFSFLCWNTGVFSNTTGFPWKRVYFNSTVSLTDLTVGDDHVCAIESVSRAVSCWRGEDGKFPSPPRVEKFLSITSGRGFSCGILMNNRTVRCWGSNSTSSGGSLLGFGIQTQFGNTSMSSLISGGSHVCGLSVNGSLICKGMNDFRQLDFPSLGSSVFSRLALGINHSCAIRESNGSVVCWGGGGRFNSNVTEGISFESIVAGSNFTCGLTTRNLSLICWGPGWSTNPNSSIDLPLPKIIPGPCNQTLCSDCGMYTDTDSLCSGTRNICKPCQTQIPQPPLLSPPPSSPPPNSPPPSSPPRVSPRSSSSSKARRVGFLAFAIVGSIGALSGICTVIYCLWTGVYCCRQKKIHNSVQPTITRVSSNPSQSGSSPLTPPFSRSSTIRRQSSRAMRRQRSGPSTKHPERAKDFSFSELAFSTNQFSLENRIGGGSFGSVYKGKLYDGREVAIKRGENGSRTKKFQEKETAFQSELAFLSRLHHKHLVGLVGFCEDKEERLLVYEYMKNGALYDHLHSKNNIDKSSSLLSSWKMRIKVSLDAARGIEYLHNYAVPPIIHRDIKSSNILLDSNWTAKVSDFGLSLLRPEGEEEFMSIKPAAGTVGYIDPEYYGLHVLTAKSDVYGFGVVLLELLTGKRAILKDEEDEGNLITLVDYVVPKIMAGELWRVLDVMVGKPEMNEAEAVELVAYTALHCVNVEGKERPTITDIVANLERALAFCEDINEIVSIDTFTSPS